jgi:PTS system mannose-specific IIA component
VNAGDGVILLTDMFGGTPSNLAISMMDRGGVEVIAGVNLPMLVKLAKTRSHQTLGECVGSAELAGRKYIAAASRVLTGNSNPNVCRSLDPRHALALKDCVALKPDKPLPFTPAPYIATSYKAGS